MPSMLPSISDYEQQETYRQKRGCLITWGLWVLSLVWIFGFSRQPGVEEGAWKWLTILAWVLLIFVVPSIGFLQGIELKHYLDWKNERTAGSWFFRSLIWLGCWLLALVSGFVGAFMSAATLKASGGSNAPSWMEAAGMWGFGLGFLVLAVILLWLPFRRLSTTTEAEDQALADLRAEQLAHPDFDAIEQQTGKKVPEDYRNLFRPGSIWLDRSWTLYPRGLEDDEMVHEFTWLIPAGASALRKHSAQAGEWVCFAEGDETELWFELGGEDPAVFECLEDDGSPSLVQISPHLSEFLAWPREES